MRVLTPQAAVGAQGGCQCLIAGPSGSGGGGAGEFEKATPLIMKCLLLLSPGLIDSDLREAPSTAELIHNFLPLLNCMF